MIERTKQKWNALDAKKQFVIKLILAALIVAAAGIFMVINKDAFYGLNRDGQSVLLKKKAVAYLGLVMLLALSIFAKNNLSDAKNQLLNLHIMEWFSVVCFIMVETVLNTKVASFKLSHCILNVLIYMLVMYLMYALTCNIRASVICVAAFSTVFGIANIYLISFRQIPLLASDFADIGTAMNVAGQFNFDLNVDVILIVCFLIVVIIWSGKIKQAKPAKRYRIVTAAVCLCFMGFMVYSTMFSTTFKDYGVKVNTFRPIKSYNTQGGLLTFAKSMQLLRIDKPEGYNAKEVDEITKPYASDSVSSEEDVKPNVIVMMNEAFSDLQSVGNFETNEEVMPFYKSLTEDTVKGFAYVSVFGGKTANSEFEFLTGNTMAFLPEGTTPYQLFIKNYVPSLTGNLKLDDYHRMIAMHPYKPSGYNRQSVYPSLGFDEFISIPDFENPSYVRNFISDDTDVNRIISEYEQSKAESDGPFYMFNVTMQNHSSYDKEEVNLPQTIEITTPECKDATAEQYLNLVHLSDAAIEKMVTYFEKQEEPTVIVLFGDHEPGLSNDFYARILGKSVNGLTDEESMELYKVPFFIWANYDIEEQYIERTSLNYLNSIMLDVTGMKKSGYNKYLLELSKEIPAMNASGYFAADGIFYKTDDVTSPYYEKVQQYNILQYNHLFDTNRKNEFFELNK